MSVHRRYLVIITALILICIVSYWVIFESEVYNNVFSEYKANHLPTIFLQTRDYIQHNVNKSSYSLNAKLFNLSSLQRSSIKSSQWINPATITNSTIIIGYCCEVKSNFQCILQKFVLILSMAIWDKPTQNLYFQKCLKTGLPPQHIKNNIITIKQRRDPLLNNNGSKQWILTDNNYNKIWFQPDMYLCQGYFWDAKVVETRLNANKYIKFRHDKAIDLLNFDISYGKTMQVAAHNLETYRPFLVTTNTEFWGGGKCTRYDVIFDTVIGRSSLGCFTIHSPPAFWYEFMRINNVSSQLILPQNELQKAQYLSHIISIKNRQRFHTLFLVKYCYVAGRYSADAVVRVAFFDALFNKYLNSNVTIDAISNCRKNRFAVEKLGNSFVSRGKDETFGYQGVRDGAVQIALKYKFQISFENSRTNGYLTEKFFNALYGYAIPIYFGDDMIATYFNEKRFINCNISDDDAKKIHALTNDNKQNGRENTEKLLLEQVNEILGERLNECVEKVIEIDNDEERYKEMLLQPIFKDNKYEGSILDPYTMANRLKKVLKFVDSYLLQ